MQPPAQVDRAALADTLPATTETEVAAVAQRRRFTAEYKIRILREADRCRHPGEVGALLRREGLYSSHLSAWRAARQRGGLSSRVSLRRGRPAELERAARKRIEELERDNERLRSKLEQAEAIIEVQKKLSSLLGLK